MLEADGAAALDEDGVRGEAVRLEGFKVCFDAAGGNAGLCGSDLSGCGGSDGHGGPPFADAGINLKRFNAQRLPA